MAKTPRIVVATLTRSTGPTGVHTHFQTFLDYLRERQIDSVLVTPFSYLRPLAMAVFGVRTVFGPLSPSFNVWWFEQWHYVFLKLALKRVLRRAGPVIVYAQCPISAKAALETRVSPDQRVVMVAHFNVSPAEEWAVQVGLRRGSRVYRAIEERLRGVLVRVDGIVYVSGFTRSTLHEAIPPLRDVRSTLLPNFVMARFDAAAEPVRNDLVSIGTLETRKNQAYLVRVVAEAKRLGRRYGLTLIGDGPDRRELERLVDALDVRDQVKFLGFQRQARRFLAAHRVYVHSALMENFAIVLVEAMASGLPVCAAPTGGIPDVFRDGREGFYWDLDDPKDGARKLNALCEDSALYARMSAAARARFENDFEAGKVAGRLLEFLVQS
jgi:glycosyltransferase involved in cell wall biosynthesis